MQRFGHACAPSSFAVPRDYQIRSNTMRAVNSVPKPIEVALTAAVVR